MATIRCKTGASHAILLSTCKAIVQIRYAGVAWVASTEKVSRVRSGCDKAEFTRCADTSALLRCTGFGSKSVSRNITCSIILTDKRIVLNINIAGFYGSRMRTNENHKFEGKYQSEQWVISLFHIYIRTVLKKRKLTARDL